jgi:hypothetical protein
MSICLYVYRFALLLYVLYVCLPILIPIDLQTYRPKKYTYTPMCLCVYILSAEVLCFALSTSCLIVERAVYAACPLSLCKKRRITLDSTAWEEYMYERV